MNEEHQIEQDMGGGGLGIKWELSIYLCNIYSCTSRGQAL